MTKIFFALTLILLMSCASEVKKPKGLILEDKMSEILVDVHIFEAQVEKLKLSKDSMTLYVDRNYEGIYKKHNVSREQFKYTFDYYEANPEQMDELYQAVVDKLSKMEADLTGEPIPTEVPE